MNKLVSIVVVVGVVAVMVAGCGKAPEQVPESKDEVSAPVPEAAPLEGSTTVEEQDNGSSTKEVKSVSSAKGNERHTEINRENPGQRIDIEPFVAKGNFTIFDFYSVYCPPCMAIAPYLEKLVEARDDIVVRKVDINRKGVQGIDWRSPLARQYELQSIPHFILYDKSGKRFKEGIEAYEQVVTWLQDAGLR